MDILKSWAHPSELLAFIRFALMTRSKQGYSHQPSVKSTGTDSSNAEEMDFANGDSRDLCFKLLAKTSRSFAAVVQDLDEELRLPICIFYLVLRGLDTVEDDMMIPSASKVPLLRSFHEKLYQPGWQFHENGSLEKDRVLLQHFDVVIYEFSQLKGEYQQVISDICQKMGNGMADFADCIKVDSKQDWNLYCHYVAGLVGIGLCRMFASSGLEDPSIAENETLANNMGLFLQKVNIIRDYREDLNDGRTFWPTEYWSMYSDTLGSLVVSEYSETSWEQKINSRNCLNLLIADTLHLVADCLEFMRLIKNRSIFRFCAIPQVMAIATLALCFDNYEVFERNVKIRKGLALKLMLDTNDFDYVLDTFAEFCEQIASRIRVDDPNAHELNQTLSHIRACIVDHRKLQKKSSE